MGKRTLLSWSSGKDCAWALHVLRRTCAFDVVGLYTVVNAKHQRVSMHAVRLALLEFQAQAVGLPLEVIEIPDPCSDEQCDAIMGAFVDRCASQGVACMAFGDLFLRGIRDCREKQLAGTGIEPVFPLWGQPTDALARDMLTCGVRAFITCVDPRQLPREYVGREWSSELVSHLPAGVDPCGENGEFHTVVVDGPMFGSPIQVRIGETVERQGFVFADVLPDGLDDPAPS